MIAVIDNVRYKGGNLSESGSGETTQEVEYANGTYGYETGHYGYFNNGSYGFIPDGYQSNSCPNFPSCEVEQILVKKITYVGVIEAVGCGFAIVAL